MEAMTSSEGAPRPSCGRLGSSVRPGPMRRAVERVRVCTWASGLKNYKNFALHKHEWF